MEELNVIHSYSRAQAIEDGVLIDVTETAKEAGFIVPVALTGAVWADYVRVPNGVSCQDEQGRLWDVLWMLNVAIRERSYAELICSALYFRFVVRNDDERPAEIIRLKAVAGPGDDGKMVVTIMLPNED